MPSAKSATRSSANSADNVGISVNEKILRECHRLYVPADSDDDKGKSQIMLLRHICFFSFLLFLVEALLVEINFSRNINENCNCLLYSKSSCLHFHSVKILDNN